MEAKRKSGLGKDVSASDIDIAQVQDDKQSEQPPKGVALGVDIGTQFCFAGCVDENKNFISLLPSSGEVAVYGIPTMVAIKFADGAITSGETAITNLKKDTSSTYCKVSPSLKTLMRRGQVTYKYSKKGSTEIKTIDVKNLVVKFIQDLLQNLKYDNIKDAVINKIVVTYPNVAEDGNTYMQAIHDAIEAEVKDLLQQGSQFKHKDKFAHDFAHDIANNIVVAREGDVAARALKGKVNSPFATIDVGGGTIDYAYEGTKINPQSDASWAIQTQLDNNFISPNMSSEKSERKCSIATDMSSNPFYFANFKRKCFAQDTDPALNIVVKCEKNDRGQSCTFFNCEEVERIINEQKNETIDNTFANIITKAINKNALGDVQKLESVVLLGGGSHMIFIQDALKKALEAKLSERKIRLYTITQTNGKNYQAIYQDDDTITTANFLAYAAALYGNISSSIATCSLDAKLIPTGYLLSATTSFPYVLAGKHPETKKTIYLTFFIKKNTIIFVKEKLWLH